MHKRCGESKTEDGRRRMREKEERRIRKGRNKKGTVEK